MSSSRKLAARLEPLKQKTAKTSDRQGRPLLRQRYERQEVGQEQGQDQEQMQTNMQERTALETQGMGVLGQKARAQWLEIQKQRANDGDFEGQGSNSHESKGQQRPVLALRVDASISTPKKPNEAASGHRSYHSETGSPRTKTTPCDKSATVEQPPESEAQGIRPSGRLWRNRVKTPDLPVGAVSSAAWRDTHPHAAVRPPTSLRRLLLVQV
jgi:hypothetical protein